ISMGSKSKKRVILPNRPDPPSVEQIVEDVNRASASDPAFGILQDGLQGAGIRYHQSRQYLDLNERLQQARSDLASKREELRAAGEHLERCMAEIKGQAL
uniref:Si:ch73-238c9.1 n=1 Tax=Paramormyrops kingsleyae TaxID=1676925 RepID=A0A3B3RIX1_9TELE